MGDEDHCLRVTPMVTSFPFSPSSKVRPSLSPPFKTHSQHDKAYNLTMSVWLTMELIEISFVLHILFPEEEHKTKL